MVAKTMNAEGQRTCSSCGNELSGVMEFCPVCMLRAGLAGSVNPRGSSASEETVERTPEQADHLFENYEIVKGEDGIPVELGRGAMGITYKAFDVDLRCLVTLKVITARYLNDESARLRFLREARAAASVRHPNVASVFHLGRTGQNYFYAMEFVEGETLESLIQRSGRLEVKLALEISAQVAAGLAAVHEQKLVHRDIKPTNIMVSFKDGNRVTAKIIDLGLSKTVGESPSQPAISVPGGFAGTPEFASPEQFAGVGVDIRSDLYSFGVTLWEMLTGKVPFRGTPGEVMYQHQHAPLCLEQLIDAPQPIVVLLQVLLEKDPKWRFQNPTDLVHALTKVDDAIKARRSVTHQRLRSIIDEQLGKRSKAASGLSRLIPAARSRRARLILWASLALLTAGGLITITSTFLTASHRMTDASISPLSPTEIPENSIAVLPFESLSDNKSDTYFADGVQDEILSSLAKVSQLKVISRTSVMTYRSANDRNLRMIANALGVANVLEGTVRRDGNRVRVTIELVAARTDQTLWTDSYDRDLTDIFAIQSEIAQTVASKLTVTLSQEERRSIEETPTDNLAAYDLYQRAKELMTNAEVSLASGNFERPVLDAITILEQAVRLDPSFTLAYCQIAEGQDLLYLSYDPTPARRALGDGAVNSAMRLQPDLPKVHLTYAYHLYFGYQDYERVRLQLAIARRGLPNNYEAIALQAYIDRRQGNFEKAIDEFNEAITLDPRNPAPISDLAYTLYAARQFRASEQVYDRLIDLVPDQPMLKVQKEWFVSFMKTGDDAMVLSAIAALPASMTEDRGVLCLRVSFALDNRDWQQAKELLEKLKDGEDDGNFAYATVPVPIGCYSILLARLQGEQPDPKSSFVETREGLSRKVQMSPGNAKLLSNLAVIDALLALKQDAIAEAQRAVEMLPISKDVMDGPGILMNLAVVYAWTDEPDLAFEKLGLLTRTPHGVYYGQLKLERLWDPLRKDARFDKLLAQLAPKD
jgi:serine/threonine protein kinase/tetratricopeptide (TPR) repeat protein